MRSYWIVRGWGPKDLAERLGVTAPTVHYWGTGRSRMRLFDVWRIAVLCDSSVCRILARAGGKVAPFTPHAANTINKSPNPMMSKPDARGNGIPAATRSERGESDLPGVQALEDNRNPAEPAAESSSFSDDSTESPRRVKAARALFPADPFEGQVLTR